MTLTLAIGSAGLYSGLKDKGRDVVVVVVV